MRSRILALGVAIGATAACSSTVTVPSSTADGGVDGSDKDVVTVADTSTDTTPACSSSNCTGCCMNGACQTGTASSGCGKNGNACLSCSAPEVCKTTQICGIDPESTWKIQPASATISTTNQGADWDVGAGAPDPYASLWCPSSTVSPVVTLTVADSFSPTWSTGGCLMKAKDILSAGFGVAVFDEDIAVDDTIAPRSDRSSSVTASIPNFA